MSTTKQGLIRIVDGNGKIDFECADIFRPDPSLSGELANINESLQVFAYNVIDETVIVGVGFGVYAYTATSDKICAAVEITKAIFRVSAYTVTAETKRIGVIFNSPGICYLGTTESDPPTRAINIKLCVVSIHNGDEKYGNREFHA